MIGYLVAAIFFATVFMFLLHVVEWRTVSGMAAQCRSESKPAPTTQTALGDRAGSTALHPDPYVLLFLMKSDLDLHLPNARDRPATEPAGAIGGSVFWTGADPTLDQSTRSRKWWRSGSTGWRWATRI